MGSGKVGLWKRPCQLTGPLSRFPTCGDTGLNDSRASRPCSGGTRFHGYAKSSLIGSPPFTRATGRPVFVCST